MKKLSLLFLLFTVCLKIYAQNPYTKRIKISVLLDGADDGDKYFLNSTAKFRLDSATVNKGKLIFNYYGEPEGLFIESGIDKKTIAVFWTDDSDMVVRASVDNLAEAEVEGSLINKKLLILKPVINELRLSRNNANISGNMQLADSVNTLIHDKYISEVKTNPNSYYALLTLYYAVAGKFVSGSEAVPLANSLGPDLEKTNLGLTFAKLIRPEGIVAVNEMAPLFSQVNEKGKLVSLSDYRGKFVLLEFWASWCGPCLVENPNLLKIYSKYNNRPFEILGISLDTDKAAWLNAIKSQGLRWPQLSDLKGQRNEVGQVYRITSLPQNVLINPSGKVVALNLSPDGLMDFLKAVFKD